MKTQSIRELAFSHKTDGRTTAENARIVKFYPTTIQRWTKQDFGRKMKARSRPGRRKLSADQEQEVLSYVENLPSI